MCSDAAHARTDREGDFDHLVERRLVTGGTKRAGILRALHRLQGRVGIEYTAATRTEHIPGKLENAQARRMQKACDRLFLVEALARGKGERIDPAKPVIGCIPNEPLECIGDLRPCRMAQHIERGWASLMNTFYTEIGWRSGRISVWVQCNFIFEVM